MSELNKKAIAKKVLAGAALLATSSPIWAKGGGGDVSEGGKSPGINRLSLDVTPGYACMVCAEKNVFSGKTDNNITPNTLSIAADYVDGSYYIDSSYIELVFSVRAFTSIHNDYILGVFYSPKLSPSPQIPTPRSINKLEIDLSAMEVLAIYEIPAQKMLARPPTRLGTANPEPHISVSFSVSLDTNKLPTFIHDGEKAYLQAVLIEKSHLEAGQFNQMILSELDTLNFVMSCPENSVSIAKSDGKIIIDDIEETGKTVATAVAESPVTLGPGKGGE